VSEKELTPEQRLAQQHLDVYSTIKDHFVSLRRLLTVAIESIDASVKVLEMNPDVAAANDDDKP
jgi:hypothetical protein